MPENKYDGICPDCREGFKNLTLEWEMEPWPTIKFKSEVVQWLTAHHVDKLRGNCELVRLIIKDVEAGFVLVHRVDIDHARADHEQDWYFEFKFQGGGDIVKSDM